MHTKSKARESMKIIDHSSDEIRQVVPGDFSLLSDADQDMTAALQSVLSVLLGGDGSETVVVSGCEVETDDRRWDGGGIINDGERHTYSYEMAPGVLLHGGRLYDFEGGSWTEEHVAAGDDLGSVLTLGWTYRCGLIVFGRETASPSPVYGEGQELTERPHQRLVAKVEQSEATVRLNVMDSAGLGVAEYSTTYATEAEDYVRGIELRWLPTVGALRKRI